MLSSERLAGAASINYCDNHHWVSAKGSHGLSSLEGRYTPGYDIFCNGNTVALSESACDTSFAPVIFLFFSDTETSNWNYTIGAGSNTI